MLYGILVAFIFPAIAFLAAFLLKDNFYVISRPALPYLVAIAFNLILIRICVKKENDKTGKGIMLATFVIMLLIFILKIHLK